MNKSIIGALLGLATGVFLGAAVGSSRKGSFFDDEDRDKDTEPTPASETPRLARDASAPVTNLRVMLDFKAMSAAYEQYGRDGVYAYLVDNNIARDSRHGSFIIDKIFVPEYEKLKHKQAFAVEATEQLQS